MIEHDGVNIPTVAPKDPDSLGVEYGFTYPLKDGEVILESQWLINNTLVGNGDEVDGLTSLTTIYQSNVTKIALSGGVLGRRYTLTNRISTSITESDDRSMFMTVKSL